MARRPFNPNLIRLPPEEEALFAPAGPLTVSQLTAMVKGAITDHLPATVHVVGEVSNFKRHSSGHLYITLKDASAELQCVMWRSAAARLKFAPADGLEVVATGNVDVWERGGRYQLYIHRLEPRGVGALELAFRQLCEKLRGQGLFDEARKRALPAFPRRIAVVTSPTGAAVRDILKTLRRRFPCVSVLIHPVPVQGKGAAQQIAAAITRLNAQADGLGGIDVMIIGRGGGSMEDLWAFNEESVARAIFASGVPVISAVGHEVDTTIADLVADARAHTPTAAAEMAVPVLAEVLEMLDTAAGRLRRAATGRLDLNRARLDAVAGHEFFRRPSERLYRLEQQLDERQSRLNLGFTRMLDVLRRRVHAGEVALGKIHPLRLHAELVDRLTRAAHRLDRAGDHRLILAERRLAAVVERLGRATPARRIDTARVRLDQLQLRLPGAMHHRLTLARHRVEAFAGRVDSVSYKNVLKRGYSITRTVRRGKVVSDPSQVRPGDKVRTETAGGAFESEVIDPNQPTLF